MTILLIGCNTADGITPTATDPATAIVVAVATDPATVIPTNTQVPTQVPAEPPTPTQPSTATSAPPATATTAPTATSAPTATTAATATLPPPPDIPFGCRTAEALAGVRAPVRLLDGPWPRPVANPNLIYNGYASGQQLVHLGFDVEGPPTHLGELLDVLDRRQVKVSMFIVGSWAETYPEWVLEFDARGHELVNHTYSHGNLRQMSPADVQAELERTETIVLNLTGQTTKPWLRPPFGSRSEESIAAAYEVGWTTVIWSGSTDDWRPEITADGMCALLREFTFDGSVLYSHTYRPEIPEVVDRYLGEIQSRGFTAVPMSVLFSANPGQYLVANE